MSRRDLNHSVFAKMIFCTVIGVGVVVVLLMFFPTDAQKVAAQDAAEKIKGDTITEQQIQDEMKEWLSRNPEADQQDAEAMEEIANFRYMTKEHVDVVKSWRTSAGTYCLIYKLGDSARDWTGYIPHPRGKKNWAGGEGLLIITESDMEGYSEAMKQYFAGSGVYLPGWDKACRNSAVAKDMSSYLN